MPSDTQTSSRRATGLGGILVGAVVVALAILGTLYVVKAGPFAQKSDSVTVKLPGLKATVTAPKIQTSGN